MSFLTGLIVAALLGADGTSSQDPQSTIVYQVKFLDMEGLDWRTSLYSKFQPISQQGGATIWSAPDDVVPRLVGRAEKVVAAPRICATAQATAIVRDSSTKTVLTDIKMAREDPVSQASFTMMDEKFTDTRVGVSLTVRGRKIDQGVLACMVISDTQVIAVHPVTLTRFDVLTPAIGSVRAPAPKAIDATIQVPEMTQCEVAGEWLIPNDGVLIVSLGVHTIADASGKAVVRERLALVQASRSDRKPETRVAYPPGPAPAHAATATKGYMNTPITMTTTTTTLPAPAAYQVLAPATTDTAPPGRRIFSDLPASVAPADPTPIPLPAMPSRALPEGRNARGEPIPLPPLPESTPLTMLPGSATPCATPQGSPVAMDESCAMSACRTGQDPEAGAGLSAGVAQAFRSIMKRDQVMVASAKANCEDLCCDDGLDCCDAISSSSTPLTFSFRVPFKGGIDLEIKAVARPVPSTPKPD